MSVYTTLILLMAGYMALNVRVLGHYVMARAYKITVHHVQFGRGPLMMSASIPGDRALCGIMLYPWCGDISVDYNRHKWTDKFLFHIGGGAGNVAAAVITVFLLQFLVKMFGDPFGNGFAMPEQLVHVPLQIMLMFVVANMCCAMFSFFPLPGSHTWEAVRIFCQHENPRVVNLMDRYDTRVLNVVAVAAITLIVADWFA